MNGIGLDRKSLGDAVAAARAVVGDENLLLPT